MSDDDEAEAARKKKNHEIAITVLKEQGMIRECAHGKLVQTEKGKKFQEQLRQRCEANQKKN